MKKIQNKGSVANTKNKSKFPIFFLFRRRSCQIFRRMHKSPNDKPSVSSAVLSHCVADGFSGYLRPTLYWFLPCRVRVWDVRWRSFTADFSAEHLSLVSGGLPVLGCRDVGQKLRNTWVESGLGYTYTYFQNSAYQLSWIGGYWKYFLFNWNYQSSGLS